MAKFSSILNNHFIINHVKFTSIIRKARWPSGLRHGRARGGMWEMGESTGSNPGLNFFYQFHILILICIEMCSDENSKLGKIFEKKIIF